MGTDLFSRYSTKRNNFCDFVFASLGHEKWSTLKGKNLLLGAQIHSFMICPLKKGDKNNNAELLRPSVYSFI